MVGRGKLVEAGGNYVKKNTDEITLNIALYNCFKQKHRFFDPTRSRQLLRNQGERNNN